MLKKLKKKELIFVAIELDVGGRHIKNRGESNFVAGTDREKLADGYDESQRFRVRFRTTT